MSIAGFDHVTIAVTDLEEAERFFAVLGFERTASVVVSGPEMARYMGIPNWEADHRTLVLRGAPDRQEVQLLRFHRPDITIDAGSGDLARTGYNHVCFKVGDLDAMLDKVRGHGIAVRGDVLDFHDRRLAFLTGPSGVVVELAEWTASAT